MKTKSYIKTNYENGNTYCKRLLLTAFVDKIKFTDKELSEIKAKAWSKSINDSTLTFKTNNNLGEGLQVFDFYIIEHLNFFDRIRHHFRMITTAIKDYIGISTIIVIVK